MGEVPKLYVNRMALLWAPCDASRPDRDAIRSSEPRRRPHCLPVDVEEAGVTERAGVLVHLDIARGGLAHRGEHLSAPLRRPPRQPPEHDPRIVGIYSAICARRQRDRVRCVAGEPALRVI